MSCLFIGMINFDDVGSRKEYEEYVQLASTIVKNYQGTYLARTEEVFHMQEVIEDTSVQKEECEERTEMPNKTEIPDKVIVISFPDKSHLKACFQSQEYRAIMRKRINNVRSKGYVVGGVQYEDQ